MPELTVKKSVALTDLSTAVNRYRHFTPGIYVCIHAPVLFEDGTRFVPGLVAMVNHGRLKQCEPGEREFVGPPNFVLDVFDASELGEYEARRDAFSRFGVTEYVAVVLGKETYCHWNRHDGEELALVQPDEKGVMKSKGLPGLWFSTTFQPGSERWTLIDFIQTGVTRVGHHEFMETIFHPDGRDPAWGDWMPFEAG